MTTVCALTLRQLVGSRRWWIVLLLAGLPVLAAVLFHVADTTTSPREYADDVTATLVASAVLPLVVLLLGVAAFGNDVGDRTLVYLTTKPVARWRVVVPKLLAVVLVGGVPVAVSGTLTIAIVEEGSWRGAAATGIGLFAGAVAYAAVFTWAGLATRHALVAGLVYVFVWEATLAAYLDGIRFLSVRRFAIAIVNGLDPERLTGVDLALGAGAAVAGVAAVGLGFTALAVRKLARMDVP